MTRRRDKGYVLGTHDEEMERLGLQHEVWRAAALDCWQRAGITKGWRVVDVGAGPGYAAADLGEMVGREGQVVALERSERFAQAAAARAKARGLQQVRVRELDLMADVWPVKGMDAAWCRWVACFVSSPELLVKKIGGALRRGGVAIFHEYADYRTWRMSPPNVLVEEFVQKVMASWRANGGEPDVARVLPGLLAKHGWRWRRRRRGCGVCGRGITRAVAGEFSAGAPEPAGGAGAGGRGVGGGVAAGT